MQLGFIIFQMAPVISSWSRVYAHQRVLWHSWALDSQHKWQWHCPMHYHGEHQEGPTARLSLKASSILCERSYSIASQRCLSSLFIQYSVNGKTVKWITARCFETLNVISQLAIIWHSLSHYRRLMASRNYLQNKIGVVKKAVGKNGFSYCWAWQIYIIT